MSRQPSPERALEDLFYGSRGQEEENTKPAALPIPSLRAHSFRANAFASPKAFYGSATKSDYASATSSEEEDDQDTKPAATDMDADERLAIALQQKEFLAHERMFTWSSKGEEQRDACANDALLAATLQYECEDDDEEYLAAKLASICTTNNAVAEDEDVQAQIMADAALAKAMAEAFEPLDEETRKLIEEFEKEAMFLTVPGRATLFVQAVLELAAKTEETLPDDLKTKLHAVNQDDMVYLAERLLKAQANLAQQSRDTSVDVGYHYTKSEECMTRIRVDGLMTLADRDAAGIPRVFNGAAYGDGVYTANNPTSYSSYGPIGLLVARLKGTTTTSKDTPADQADTVIGMSGNTDEIIVLRKSAHCLPLIEYATSLASTHMSTLVSLQQKLESVVSKYLVVPPMTSSGQASSVASATTSPFRSLKIAAFNLPDNLTYTAPSMLSVDPIAATTPAGSSADECAICLAKLSHSVVSLNYCGHKFHRECLLHCTRAGQRSCAICRKLFQEPQGLCPSGTLTVSYSNSQACSGFPVGTITLDYNIPNGIQHSYHPSPGVAYSGATRQAFLPNNKEGRELLKRLKYAFSRGLTFTVGTSLTSGTSNVVTWASIHHKTSLSGGPHGYPDGAYFGNCHRELDHLGVPAADEFQ